jgi:uncharacterized protein YceK
MRAILATVALSFAGCATAANTVWLNPEEGGQRFYGGVRADLEAMDSAAKRESGIRVSGESVPLSRMGQAKRFAWFGLDLPLSAVGDTLTLPLIIACQLSERRTMIRSWQPGAGDYEKLRAWAEQQSDSTSDTPLPPPSIGLDRFPEVRHRVGTQ